MVAVELEALSKKLDRFGWERDRGTAAQDRIILDWMDALQDYPLGEIRRACQMSVIEKPSRFPNEGHILEIILRERRKEMRRVPEPEPERQRVTAEQAQAILRGAGISVKVMGE